MRHFYETEGVVDSIIDTIVYREWTNVKLRPHLARLLIN